MTVEETRVTLGQHSRAGGDGANQDFHGAVVPRGAAGGRKGIAVAIADGIGSSPVSQEASAAAVRGFLADYYATSETWSVRRSAERVLAATNAWLHAQNQRGSARFDKDLGHVCTFSALILKGREVHLFHVGDARIYRVHAQGLEQLTEDHRVGGPPGESFLGRALGVNASVEIDYRCLPAEKGAVYLLATDGAYGLLDAGAVRAILAAWGNDFDRAARALVAEAQGRGSEDDATVQLLRIDALPPADAGRAPLARDGLALPPALAPRMRFEGYEIVRELHASSRSHVHLAVDEASGAKVVIKTPSADLRDDADYLDRFVLEEWVARRLRSPHVLAAAPDTRPRSHLFVATEYVEGQTLAQWMTDHPRPSLDEVRRIVVQVAAGLEAFHGREMLHQDLRPQNVIIDGAGTAKLIDFASAHVAGLAEHAGAACAEAIAGTLQYTAPEYFVGAGGTARSEVFALAVLTWQMLAGTLPYGLQVARLRAPRDLRRLRYTPVRERRRDLPPWVDAVLRKALDPDPARRQEAASEFAHDLVSPGPAFLREAKTPLVERNPLRFWQASTALLALAVVGLLGRLLLR